MTTVKNIVKFKALVSAAIGASFAIIVALPPTAAKEPDPVPGDAATMTEGTGDGETCINFLACWGMRLGLLSHPGNRAREAEFKGRLWNPRS